MTDRKTFRVGFYVEVEVEAHERTAALVAESACQWPGDWSPPHDPVEVRGYLDTKPVKAKVLRSQALMVKRVED